MDHDSTSTSVLESLHLLPVSSSVTYTTSSDPVYSPSVFLSGTPLPNRSVHCPEKNQRTDVILNGCGTGSRFWAICTAWKKTINESIWNEGIGPEDFLFVIPWIFS